jgi:hypothetical protein
MKTLPVFSAAALLGLLSCAQPATQQDVRALHDEVRQLKQQVEQLQAQLNAPKSPDREEPGRYQLAGNPVFLLDTASGQVWQPQRDPRTNETWWKENAIETGFSHKVILRKDQ